MGKSKAGIVLMGKGATNHLHRQEVIDAFREKGFDVHYFIRDSFEVILEKLERCSYSVCRVVEKEAGFAVFTRNLFRYVRALYPAGDKAKMIRFAIANKERNGIISKTSHRFFQWMARHRWLMYFMVKIEDSFYKDDSIEGVGLDDIDILVLLGFGAVGSHIEGNLSCWARRNNIPVVNMVGNYDNLSTKGFRGTDVDKLLVWGPSMKRDAIKLQLLPEEKIKIIGSIKYNSITNILHMDKDTFFKKCGLDPNKKTILFAGSRIEFHYFEIFEVLKYLRENHCDCQLILRLYPNKHLMDSPYIKPLLDFANNIPGVFVSYGDRHYSQGAHGVETLNVEENELWHSIKYSDVVVNLFSTLAIEACIFDKPVINMWYFRAIGRLVIREPDYFPYDLEYHVIRVRSYGGMKEARNREELIGLIQDAIANPDKLSQQRKKIVENEVGMLDGNATHRLIDSCVETLSKS